MFVGASIIPCLSCCALGSVLSCRARWCPFRFFCTVLLWFVVSFRHFVYILPSV